MYCCIYIILIITTSTTITTTVPLPLPLQDKCIFQWKSPTIGSKTMLKKIDTTHTTVSIDDGKCSVM